MGNRCLQSFCLYAGFGTRTETALHCDHLFSLWWLCRLSFVAVCAHTSFVPPSQGGCAYPQTLPTLPPPLRILLSALWPCFNSRTLAPSSKPIATLMNSDMAPPADPQQQNPQNPVTMMMMMDSGGFSMNTIICMTVVIG